MKLFLKLAVILFSAGLALGAVFFLHPLWFADQGIRLHLWRVGARSRYVLVGGARIHFLEARPPQGSPEKPLVLLHGLGARGEDWFTLIPGLTAQGFHVFVPDLLGYGRSPKPDVSYSIALEEKVVEGFLDAVHLPKADVAGWSMGGWVAMKLAADHPTRVNRLLLYDSAGTYFTQLPAPGLFTPTDQAGLARLMATISPHPRTLPSFIARDVLRRFGRNAWVVERSMAQMQSGRDLMDFRLGDIRQPTLIVWGSADALIPLETGRNLHRGIPNSTLDVIDGCGHIAPAECWRPVLAATLDFLNTAPPHP